MKRVIFVCLGNICRSPAAELVFKAECARRGIKDVEADSFGTSDEEAGNGIYPPMARELKSRGIFGSHVAKQLRACDVARADYVLAAESRNVTRILLMTDGRYADKLHLICDYTSVPRDVADPYYTGDYKTALDDIQDGVNAFLDFLTSDQPQ